jgi:hypothetical protein
MDGQETTMREQVSWPKTITTSMFLLPQAYQKSQKCGFSYGTTCGLDVAMWGVGQSVESVQSWDI